MARISLISPESATAEVKEIYEKTLRGKPGNAQKAFWLIVRRCFEGTFSASMPAWDALWIANCMAN